MGGSGVKMLARIFGFLCAQAWQNAGISRKVVRKCPNTSKIKRRK